jgi:hypothetical protein
MAPIPIDALHAAQRYGHLVDPIAAQYRNPVTGQRLSGTALLLKLSSGENGFKMGGAPSSAGARGATQFTAGSRRTAIQKFGIDPWRSYDEAFHGAALHLLGKINGSKGLQGYNPGDPGYTNYILGQKVGHITPGAGGSSQGPVSSGAPSATSLSSGLSSPDTTPGGTGLADLISALGAQKQPAGAASVPDPSFSSMRYLPTAGATPVMAPPPQQGPDTDSLIQALSQLQGPDTAQGVGSAIAGAQSGPQAPQTGGHGKVTIAPGADRSGVGLQKPILSFLSTVAGRAGRPINITTGTNHNQFVAGSNRQSDHWTGNAADIAEPIDSRQGDLLAAHAISTAGGIPFQKALGMARKGGVFNFQTPQGRVQVLWKTMVGGNHHNHVHIGLNPGR